MFWSEKRDQYEEAYRQAREALFRRGKAVGRPVRSWDSIRRCPVNGRLVTDRELFLDAWGEKLAEQILPKSANCSDCGQLWREYDVVTKQNVALLLQGTDGRDLQRASEARNSLRQYLREHGSSHA